MVKIGARPEPDWVRPFLVALRQTGNLRASERAANMSRSSHHRRRRDAQFAAEWAACLQAFGRGEKRASPPPSAALPLKLSKREVFLEALAETSCIAAAAERAGLPLREVYKLRRRNAPFAAAWRAALVEGYDMLEIELLGHLRNPDPARRMDVASAMRLLAAHRETVLRERALREDDDEEAVMASLDRFIDDMRARREANAALLIQQRPANGSDADDQGGSGDAAG